MVSLPRYVGNVPLGDIRLGRNERAANRGAALLHHRDVASPAMEVGAVLSMNGFEAIGDAINNWHLGVFGLG
jgi:hypothetical protein